MLKSNGVHALVRRTHEERVLAVLRERGALSRAELGGAAGLSRTTVSEITADLLARGAVLVVDTDAAGRTGSGRPAQRLAMDPHSGQWMGVDFGHRRVHVVVADASHEVLASGSAPYDQSTGWDVRLETAFALVADLAARTGVHYGALRAVGIGVPGPVATTSSGWRSVAETFERRFDATTTVDNNTRLAALAEAVSAPGGSVEDLLYVRLGDGVGGGLVVGGRLVSGSSGLAGEMGHVRVARPTGQLDQACRCGRTGCLETVASVPAILAACRERGLQVHRVDDLARHVGDGALAEVLEEVSVALATVIGAAATVVDPSRVVVGGAITRVVPTLVPQVAAALAAHLAISATTASGAPPTVDVRAAVLGDDDGALGAIVALLHRSPLLTGYPETGLEPSSAPSRTPPPQTAAPTMRRSL